MSQLTEETMHSYTHKRNEAKIKEAEAELEALLKGDVAEEASDETPEEEPNGEGSETTEVSDAGDTKQEEAKEETKASEDDAELSAEEKSFKKRYGDIQRHMAETEKKQAAQIKRLEDQLEKAAKNELVLPKSKEEIDAWSSKHPDVAGIVEAIAEQKANERAIELDERLQEIEELRSTAKREKAEAQLVAIHPDFEAIRADDEFHAWVDTQPKVYQDALYENSEDVKSVARVIDMYKLDKGIKTKKPSADKGAASSVKTRGRTVVDAEESSKTLSESMINKMSLKEYEERQDEIMSAMRSGKFIYDMS
jgi:hypothetical protein